MSWIQTRSGRAVYPLAPTSDTIDIEDIAHALSQICRFGGHTSAFYSVAQHSVLVSQECPGYELEALLHDAAEAYLGDVPRPLKSTRPYSDYRAAEWVLEGAIYRKFGIVQEVESVTAIAIADRRMLRTEQRDLMPPPVNGEDRSDAEPYLYRIVPWDPAEARERFLERFHGLSVKHLTPEAWTSCQK